jgi:hypothetical protein
LNDISRIGPDAEVPRDGRVKRDRGKRAKKDWIDWFAGKLDEDFARGALDRPRPGKDERSDLSFG